MISARDARLTGAAIGLEWRVHRRIGVPLLLMGLTTVWTVIIATLDPGPARLVALSVLLFDTSAFGVLFAALLLLSERTSGAWAALRVSPVGTGHYVTARLTIFTVLSAVSAVFITAAARPGIAQAVVVIGGCAMLTALLCALVLAACATALRVSGVVLAVAVALGPMLVPVLLLATELLDHRLLYVMPTAAAFGLIQNGLDPRPAFSGATLALLGCYALVSACAMGGLAAWRLDRVDPVGAAQSRPGLRRRALDRSRPPWPASPWRSLWRIDFRSVVRDPMLWAAVAGPAVVALGLRFGIPRLTNAPVLLRHGIDLAAWRPVLFASLALLHVPLMMGSLVALRTVEDREHGVVTLLGVTPFGTGRYLGYRAVLAAAPSAIGLAVAIPLSGLADDTFPALVLSAFLAGPLAPMVMLLTISCAQDRAGALIPIKLAAALATLTPVIVWVLGPSWAWTALVLPPAWPLVFLSGFATMPMEFTVPAASAGTVCLTALLWWRACARLDIDHPVHRRSRSTAIPSRT